MMKYNFGHITQIFKKHTGTVMYNTENELLMQSLSGVKLSHATSDDTSALLWANLTYTDIL